MAFSTRRINQEWRSTSGGIFQVYFTPHCPKRLRSLAEGCPASRALRDVGHLRFQEYPALPTLLRPPRPLRFSFLTVLASSFRDALWEVANRASGRPGRV